MEDVLFPLRGRLFSTNVGDVSPLLLSCLVQLSRYNRDSPKNYLPKSARILRVYLFSFSLSLHARFGIIMITNGKSELTRCSFK